MKLLFIIILISLSNLYTFSQPSIGEMGKMAVSIGSIEIINIKGDTLLFSDLIKGESPVALFFCFAECFGCKLSLEETLLPNYKMLGQIYGLKIVAISKDAGEKRRKTEELFSKYPFELYFDIDNNLFAEMPLTSLKDGRKLRAWPALVIFDSRYNYISVDPFNIDIIRESLKKLQEGKFY